MTSEMFWFQVIPSALFAGVFLIPVMALFVLRSKRPELGTGSLFWAVALFLAGCGVSNLLSIVAVWLPIGGVDGIVKLFTAAAGVVAAAMLWQRLPELLTLPSRAELRTAEAALAREGIHRREAEDMLRQAQNVEAIGQLTGGLAHDFNNLLTVISGNLEIAERSMKSSGDLPERLTRVIGNAASGARKAATLTDRLLAFARRQSLDPRPADLNRLLAGMSDAIRRTVGENVQLKIVEGAGLWEVAIDHSQMESTLLNLVVNARDAMGGKGKLTIETGNVSIDEAYAQQNANVSVGQYVLVAVSDSGDGMTREIQSGRSIRSSPPSRKGRAPASASARSMVSSGSPAATSKSTARSARVRQSISICRAAWLHPP